MTHWLIDPSLLTFDANGGRKDVVQFALMTSELSQHNDAVIGIRSYLWLMEQYTGNWPGHDLKFPIPELTQAVQRLLPQILQRVLSHDEDSYMGTCAPNYLGPQELRSEILSDAVASARCNAEGLVSSAESWDASSVTLDVCVDGLADQLPLFYEVSCIPDKKRLVMLRKLLSRFRLRVVGDKLSEDICERLQSECGILLDSADWIPSEKKKVPRDLAKRWGQLRPETDIAVCITGRIGHETSSIAAACGKPLGPQYIEVEFARDIPDALLRLGERLGAGHLC